MAIKRAGVTAYKQRHPLMATARGARRREHGRPKSQDEV